MNTVGVELITIISGSFLTALISAVSFFIYTHYRQGD